jgi:hypothetical protein
MSESQPNENEDHVTRDSLDAVLVEFNDLERPPEEPPAPDKPS